MERPSSADNLHQVHLTKVLVGKRPKEHALEHRGGDGQDQLVRGHYRAISKAEPEVFKLLLTDDTLEGMVVVSLT